MDEIDFKALFNFFKKKLWVIILFVILAIGCGAVYVNFFQKPDYKSYATVLLGNSSDNATTTTTDVTLNKSLIGTYSEIVKSRRVLDQVNSELRLKMDFEEISSYISVADLDDAQIIKITATNGDAKIAQKLASSTAKYFIEEVTELYQLNNVSILDDAVLADEPYNIDLPKQYAIYALIGFVLGCTIVFMVFYFDGTIKNASQVEEQVKLTVLGKVHESNFVTKLHETVLVSNPKAIISEDIRTARVNILNMMQRNKSKVILISSSVPGEGKSFISTNLAIAMAQLGKHTIIIDCDLRRGRLREIFKISNKRGLSELLSSSTRTLAPGTFVAKGSVPNLDLISCGAEVSNPSELLGSPNFRKMLSMLRAQYDCIILDCPPTQGLPDSVMMASAADETIVVCANGYTNMDVLNSTKKAYDKVGVKVAGVVINRVKQSEDTSYNGKYSRSYGKYYGSDRA